MYEYCAKILNVVDADTLDLRVDCGFYMFLENRFRLPRIDAPEMNTHEGVAAKAYIKRYEGMFCTIQTTKNPKDKYGRYLAEIFVGGVNLSDELLRLGLATHWDR